MGVSILQLVTSPWTDRGWEPDWELGKPVLETGTGPALYSRGPLETSFWS